MYQLDATIYYDFIIIKSLYMFRTFTCPSSGVLIYNYISIRNKVLAYYNAAIQRALNLR